MDLPRDNRGNGFLLMLYGDVGGGGGRHGPRLTGRGIRGEHELRRHPVREGRQTKVSLKYKERLFLNISEHLESNTCRNFYQLLDLSLQLVRIQTVGSDI